MATATGPAERAPDRRTIATRGGAAVVLAVAANLALLGAVLAGDLVEPFDPLSVDSVVALTAAGALGATAVYWLLARRREDRDRDFAVVAAVVLVLSLVPDVLLLEADPAATVPAVVVLMAMHVVAAAICVVALTGNLRRLVP